jgi:hypothetical protein
MSITPELKKTFDSFQPLSDEIRTRLDKKFRLEWNFNSNHINPATEGKNIDEPESKLRN